MTTKDQGRRSPRVTEHMLNVVHAIKRHGQAAKAAGELGRSVEAVVMLAGVVESKAGTRLFHRTAGRGLAHWDAVSSPAASAFWAWAALNPQGGDYPKPKNEEPAA